MNKVQPAPDEWTNKNDSSSILLLHFCLAAGLGKMLLHCPYQEGGPWTTSNNIAMFYIDEEAFTSTAQMKHQQLQITEQRGHVNARGNGCFHDGSASVYQEHEFPSTFSWSSWFRLIATKTYLINMWKRSLNCFWVSQICLWASTL